MNEENIFKTLGVGRRKPDDLFFSSGDKACHMLQREGIVESIDEDINKRVVESFPCCIPICKLVFPTLAQFEMHYNSCHRFICSQCKKPLPSPHILDLHLCEVHDSYFKAQAERKPMYRCFVESCDHTCLTADQRRAHCIEVHKFPHDFRFDYSHKKGAKGKTNNNLKHTENIIKNNTSGQNRNFTFGQSSVKGNIFVPRQYLPITTKAKQKQENDVESMNEDFRGIESSSLNLNELMDTLPTEPL